MRDHDDCHAERFLQLDDQLVDSHGHDRIEAGGRLIAEQDVRVHGNGASQAGALFHAARELCRLKGFKPTQADEIELDARHDADGRVFELRVFLQWQGHVLADGHGIEQGCTLEKHAHLFQDRRHLLFRHPGNVLALDKYRTTRRAYQTDHVPEQGTFPTTGATEDGHDLALVNIQINPFQDMPVAIVRVEIADFYNRFFCHCAEQLQG